MLKILIADDHAIVRKGLKQILIEEYPSVVVGEVADTEGLMTEIVNHSWNIVICDMNMPGRSGLDALNQLKQVAPQLPVLIMSIYPEDQYALRAIKAGAAGYLAKETIHDDIIKAIQTVQLGKKFITPAVAEKLADAFDPDTAWNALEKLLLKRLAVWPGELRGDLRAELESLGDAQQFAIIGVLRARIFRITRVSQRLADGVIKLLGCWSGAEIIAILRGK